MIKSELLKYLFFSPSSFLSEDRKSRECFTRISLLLFFRTRVLNNSICTKSILAFFRSAFYGTRFLETEFISLLFEQFHLPSPRLYISLI